jgi:hypothetical protein
LLWRHGEGGGPEHGVATASVHLSEWSIREEVGAQADDPLGLAVLVVPHMPRDVVRAQFEVVVASDEYVTQCRVESGVQGGRPTLIDEVIDAPQVEATCPLNCQRFCVIDVAIDDKDHLEERVSLVPQRSEEGGESSTPTSRGDHHGGGCHRDRSFFVNA